MGFAGIHLSGSNAQRSAVVVLHGSFVHGPLYLNNIYHRIGSQGGLFSDERIMHILTHEMPLDVVMVDCPLTVPPCVSCQRPVCPGVIACEDVGVAYMLAINGQRKKAGLRKKRPINPQSQRLWDVTQFEGATKMSEPTFSANMAPLVIRARTLQRRLNALTPAVTLVETAVSAALAGLFASLSLEIEEVHRFRSFEQGAQVREDIVDAMVEKSWLRIEDDEHYDLLCNSLDVFQALITAVVAAMYAHGLVEDKPQTYPANEGWVFLPKVPSGWRVGL